jgi:hypothetical protein
MTFDWDNKKAESNRKKHDVSFYEATTAFNDPWRWTAVDDKHSHSEERTWLIGETETGRIVVVIFTYRDEGKVCRLISARLSNRKEKKIYEASKNISL